jgi:cystathionine beta-lyase
MNKDVCFDFNTPVDRCNTASMKWERYPNQDIIPLWVADMDFCSPPAVIDALHRRIDHGVFGYTIAPESLKTTVVEILEAQFGWTVQPKWLVWLPGLVTGFNVACRAAGQDADDIMTAVPVYPHFLTAPANSRRHLIKVPLMEKNNRWGFDFDRLEKAITPKTCMFMLCNPHNPVGRVFSREELSTLAAICEKHDIIICSDEIHCDLILDKDKIHIPTATLGADVAQQSITLMSPSKTYNLPGLGCAFAVISDGRLRRRFIKAMAGIVPHVNAMGYAAAEAAYRDCVEWHAALLDYLRGNHDTVASAVEEMPRLSMAPVEATYLAWIDVRDADLADPIRFFEDAGVGLQDGAEFGGPGFVRLNFGCPRPLLVEALDRMKTAMDKHIVST